MIGPTLTSTGISQCKFSLTLKMHVQGNAKAVWWMACLQYKTDKDSDEDASPGNADSKERDGSCTGSSITDWCVPVPSLPARSSLHFSSDKYTSFHYFCAYCWNLSHHSFLSLRAQWRSIRSIPEGLLFPAHCWKLALYDSHHQEPINTLSPCDKNFHFLTSIPEKESCGFITRSCQVTLRPGPLSASYRIVRNFALFTVDPVVRNMKPVEISSTYIQAHGSHMTMKS